MCPCVYIAVCVCTTSHVDNRILTRTHVIGRSGGAGLAQCRHNNSNVYNTHKLFYYHDC